MRPETRKAMEMLFTAKWNIPKAAKYCNLTNKEMKITFNEYCNFHDATYIPEDGNIQLNLFNQTYIKKIGVIL